MGSTVQRTRSNLVIGSNTNDNSEDSSESQNSNHISPFCCSFRHTRFCCSSNAAVQTVSTQQQCNQEACESICDSPNSSSHRNPFVDTRYEELTQEEYRRRNRQLWKSEYSLFFPCFSCMIGALMIDRISLMITLYKGPFVLQFMLLSLILGTPFTVLMMNLGQYTSAGITEMWYILPALKGVGYAVLSFYFMYGVYTTISISYTMSYLCDSMVTARDIYRWAGCSSNISYEECTADSYNGTDVELLLATIPAYYRNTIMLREVEPNHTFISFGLCFSQGIIWLLVFMCLFKGLYAYGKVINVISCFSIFAFLCSTCKFVSQWPRGLIELFIAPWANTMTDPWVWLLSCREVFFTLIIYGGVILQIYSHNKSEFSVKYTVIILMIAFTLFLMLISLTTSCISYGLQCYNITLTPVVFNLDGSDTVSFLHNTDNVTNKLTIVNYVLGESFLGPVNNMSYHSLPFYTELFPALVALEGPRKLSQFWTIISYLSLVLFGFSQLLSVWFFVIEGFCGLNSNKLAKCYPVISFIACITGFLLSLPFTSQLGPLLVYFFDFCYGCLWWISCQFFMLICAVAIKQGRPCSSLDLLQQMFHRISFEYNWTLLYLILFLAVIVISFCTLQQIVSSAWPYWSSELIQLSVAFQSFPLLIIIFILIMQFLRYSFSKDGNSFTENMKNMLFPAIPMVTVLRQASPTSGRNSSVRVLDPPPSYTPPPSYSVATSRFFSENSEAAYIQHYNGNNKPIMNPISHNNDLLDENSLEELPEENNPVHITSLNQMSLPRNLHANEIHSFNFNNGECSNLHENIPCDVINISRMYEHSAISCPCIFSSDTVSNENDSLNVSNFVSVIDRNSVDAESTDDQCSNSIYLNENSSAVCSSYNQNSDILQDEILSDITDYFVHSHNCTENTENTSISVMK